MDNFAKAIEIITEALRIELENESLLRNLGFVYFHAEEYEETIMIFWVIKITMAILYQMICLGINKNILGQNGLEVGG